MKYSSHPGGHGGGVARAARELGLPESSILDFSASINPLGMPAGVREAALAALERALHYPEIDARALVEALATDTGLPAGCLLAGNGSTELIYLLPRVLRPRRALVVAPAFSEYARALELAGVETEYFLLQAEEEFRLDPDRLADAVRPGTDLLILANPANPLGTALEPGLIRHLARALEGRCLLMVDEAFVDFCPELSLVHCLQEHPNVYLMRSLTKFYAMPGLRAGFAAGPPQGMARLAAAQLPWSLSTPAQAAALAALAQVEYRRRTLELIPELRRGLEQGLGELGLRVFPSRANYLLARLEQGPPGAPGLCAALRKQGILVRDCSNFCGLDERYIRVAVRSAPENARLLEALSTELQRRVR